MSPKKYGQEFSISIPKSVTRGQINVSTKIANSFVNNRVVLVFTYGMITWPKDIHAGKCSFFSKRVAEEQRLWWFSSDMIFGVNRRTCDLCQFSPKVLAKILKECAVIFITFYSINACVHMLKKVSDWRNKHVNSWFLTKMILFCRTDIIWMWDVFAVYNDITRLLLLQHCCSTHLVLLSQLQYMIKLLIISLSGCFWVIFWNLLEEVLCSWTVVCFVAWFAVCARKLDSKCFRSPDPCKMRIWPRRWSERTKASFTWSQTQK